MVIMTFMKIRIVMRVTRTHDNYDYGKKKRREEIDKKSSGKREEDEKRQIWKGKKEGSKKRRIAHPLRTG